MYRFLLVVMAALSILGLLCGCGGAGSVPPSPLATPAATSTAAGNPAELIATARTEIQDAVSTYAAGQKDAAYEKAANVYLKRFEGLEPGLLKLDKEAVPAIEEDFKGLRDAIKAGQPQADVATIATRLDGKLVHAAALLAK